MDFESLFSLIRKQGFEIFRRYPSFYLARVDAVNKDGTIHALVITRNIRVQARPVFPLAGSEAKGLVATPEKGDLVFVFFDTGENDKCFYISGMVVQKKSKLFFQDAEDDEEKFRKFGIVYRNWELGVIRDEKFTKAEKFMHTWKDKIDSPESEYRFIYTKEELQELYKIKQTEYSESYKEDTFLQTYKIKQGEYQREQKENKLAEKFKYQSAEFSEEYDSSTFKKNIKISATEVGIEASSSSLKINFKSGTETSMEFQNQKITLTAPQGQIVIDTAQEQIQHNMIIKINANTLVQIEATNIIIGGSTSNIMISGNAVLIRGNAGVIVQGPVMSMAF